MGKQQPEPETNQEYNRFLDFTKKIVAVPQKAIDDADKKHDAEKPKRKAAPKKMVVARG